MNKADIYCFFKTIDYEPHDIRHFKIALTHSSYTNESGDQTVNNEKYEFLGDAVLGFVVADYLFREFPDLDEGILTKTRARIICEKNLTFCAKEIGIGKYLVLGKGEIGTKGFDKPSILSDSFEAVIGAIYLDKGIDFARKFTEEYVLRPFLRNGKNRFLSDAKTLLQEKAQKNGTVDIKYEVVEQTGPDHDKLFSVIVRIGSTISGRGKGKSKKEAEQDAAKEAISKYYHDNI